MNKLKNFFSLKGTWNWACKQLKNGHIIYRRSDTGAARYRLDQEGQQRIMWIFDRNPPKYAVWSEAYIFLKDFTAEDWTTYK